MSWEIWTLAQDGTGRILEILPFGDDDGEARAKFSDMQAIANVQGGTLELRRSGQRVCFHSVTLPDEVTLY